MNVRMKNKKNKKKNNNNNIMQMKKNYDMTHVNNKKENADEYE